MAYQIYCEHHDYGPSRQIFDEVRRDKDEHVYEFMGMCGNAVEIHESDSSFPGGHRVLEGGDGTQLPNG